MNYIIFDTETGGLNAKINSLLTLGVIFVKDGKIVKQREWRFKKKEYNVTAGAMKVNKIDLVKLYEQGQTIDEIRREFISIMRETYGTHKPTAMGHNIEFDLNFIYEQFLDKKAWEHYVSYRKIDTAGIARFLQDTQILETRKADLSSLMVFFNLGSELSEDRHTALFDAKCTWKVYNGMMKLVKER